MDTWAAVDRYIEDHLIATDPALEATLLSSDQADLPKQHVSAAQGKLLHLLAKVQRAHRILEIGTLAGYSTIWLARALPAGGQLISLEVNPKHAEVAVVNIANAGLAEKVQIRVAPAIESLPPLVAEKIPPFDLIFIDADKASTCDYFDWALKLSRAGTVIIVDNVIRKGAVIDANTGDPSVDGVRQFHQMLSQETRVTATTIQTVGCKGYDGFTFVVVNEVPSNE